MELKLNIQESSIRKKRGKSFFVENKLQELGGLEPEHASQLAKIAKLNIKERNNRSHDVTAQSKSAMLKNGKLEPVHGLCTTVEVDRESSSIMPKSLLKAST